MACVFFIKKHGPVTADRHVSLTWQHWDSHPLPALLFLIFSNFLGIKSTNTTALIHAR